MSFVEWVQAHRRSILFFLLALAAAGMVAAFKLPVTLFPNVSFPRVRVDLDAGDRPARLMALQVTIPVEEAVRRVPGVRDVRSTTSRGSAEVYVNFGWGADMALATSQVNEAITQILPSLPHGTRLRTLRMDPTVDPILSYSLTSKTQSLTRLHDLARYQLLPLLSSVDGVARVGVTGGTREEYRVTVDPARLQAYGLTLTDVANALGAANVVTAVGRLEDHYKLYLAVSDTRLKTPAQIRSTILRTGANGVVRLSDVATVADSTVPQWIRVTADGRDAVLLDIYQQPGGNSVRISADVKAKLAAYRPQLPPGVRIAKWYDQSQLVVAAAKSVRDAILIGAGLAALVLLAFLRNLKTTLIAVIVLPTVLAATVVLLYALGMSFNIMTLGGMAAAVGLIIDDAIVMIEHIVRRLRGAPREHHGRVMAAALEFARPLAGSSASTIVIFVPLAFLTGVTGAFFKALALTMAAGLAISYLVTWLAVPILADHLLGERDANQKEGGALTDWFHRRYEAVMRRVLARPAWVLAGVLPLLAAGWLAYQHVGSGFMPHMDEGGFILDYVSPPGTSLTETDRLLRQVEGIIERNPWVATYSRRTGTQLGGGVTEANEGDFFIRLKPFPRPPIEKIMNSIRTQVEQQVPGLEIELAQLMEDLIGDLTAVPQPIEIKIYSDDAQRLRSLAHKVKHAIDKVPGVVDTNSGIHPAGDALEVHVDRVKAALEGVDPEAVTRLLESYLGGTVTTRIQRGPKLVGVRVWIPKALRRHHARHRRAAAARAGRAPLPAVAGRARGGRDRPAADHARKPEAHGGGDRAHQRARPGLGDPRRETHHGPARDVAQRRLLRARRPVQAAADRVPRPRRRVRRRGRPGVPAAAVPVRELPRRARHPRDPAARGVRRLRRPVGDRDRAEHLGDDGHDDDRRHRHRGGDLLLLRVSRPRRRPGPPRGADRGRQEPHAPDRDDHLRRDPDALAARVRHRPGLGDAAAARGSDYRRPDGATAARAARHAGAVRHAARRALSHP